MSSRRVVLGLALTLAGCGPAEQAAPSPAPEPTGPIVLGPVSDIPVGGGKIYSDRRVAVTQPEAGVLKAFRAVCTHQGCTLDDVSDGVITCPCHASAFRIADGTVANGPATRALQAKQITVVNGQITLG